MFCIGVGCFQEGGAFFVGMGSRKINDEKIEDFSQQAFGNSAELNF